MLIGKSEIARMIPHAGAMCLLDGVTAWDATSIRCISATHRDERNPLRARSRLSAICGIEYAAQAMALHGSLTAKVEGHPRMGYLASVRDLVCHSARLDTLDNDLAIEAELLMGDDRRAIYRFELHCNDALVSSGRAAVVLSPEAA